MTDARRPSLLFAIAMLGLVALALSLRLVALGEKPLHQDEGVNGWLSLQLFWSNTYQYLPNDNHGPLLYYVNLLSFWLLGPSEVSLRLPNALIGGLLPLLLLPLRRALSNGGVLTAGLLFAVSPGLVYFSRTAIHEVQLVAFTLLWAVALIRFAAEPRTGWALWAALGAAGCFASKETAVLTTACLASGAALAWLLGRREESAADLFKGRTRREALWAWSVNASVGWGLGALLFAVVLVVFFSSFGTYPAGVQGFFEGFEHWFEYGSSGRNQSKPVGYFWSLLAITQGLARWTALAAAGLALLLRSRVGVALTGWFLSALLIYSLIPYKTPWCGLQIDLPAFLLLGWAAGISLRTLAASASAIPIRGMAGGLVLACVAPAVPLLRSSLEDLHERYDDFKRPYVYYQTYRQYSEQLREAFGVRDAAGRSPRVLNVGQEFPFRWYTLTRGWPEDLTIYLEGELPSGVLRESLRDADIVISDSRYDDDIDAGLAEHGGTWHKERYLVRPGIWGFAWYRRELWDRYQAVGGRSASLWPRPSLASDRAPGRPNILLISVDTLRADHLGCYGYARDTSPHIDALAADGTVFEQVSSTSSWTLPSHASILTGRYPSHHRLQDDGLKLPSDIPTLAGGLQAAGYHTLAVVSHVYVSSAFGLERGFEAFDDSLIEGGSRNPIAEEVVERVLERLTRETDRPYFAFVHFFDPHWPYTPPGDFGERFADPDYDGSIDGSMKSLNPFLGTKPMSEADREQMVALYDAEIAYVDHQLGRMLSALRERGLLDNTLVLLTGDHGEEFKEHGGLGHGRTLYGEQLGVPLIASGHPSFAPGSRSHRVVSSVDLTATILDLAGADPLPGADGQSLVRDRPEDRLVVAESIRFGIEMRALRAGVHKLIRIPSQGIEVFYDLRADPFERNPLAVDPSGGWLSAAMDDYAAAVEVGWHLKLVGLWLNGARCRLTVRTPGRLLQPRHYASGNITGRKADFHEFSLDSAGRELRVDVSLTRQLAEIVFETDPPTAPITLEQEGQPCGEGIFLGAGESLPGVAVVTLDPSDARLVGVPRNYFAVDSGIYVRSVQAPQAGVTGSELSPEAIERLESLGYGHTSP